MSIVILHGAPATGKTRRSEQFKRHYGCSRIVDGWDGRAKLKDGDLAITNETPPFNVPGAKVVDVVTAKAAVTA